MDFFLTDEQKLIADTARKVGERFGLDYWRDHDTKKAFPSEFWAAVCEAGLCGVALPEEYGGSGLGMLEMALIVEALSASGGGSTGGKYGSLAWKPPKRCWSSPELPKCRRSSAAQKVSQCSSLMSSAKV